MGCWSCRALIRGRVLLVRVEPGRGIPLPAKKFPFLIATPPRRDRLLLAPPPGEKVPPVPRGVAGIVYAVP